MNILDNDRIMVGRVRVIQYLADVMIVLMLDTLLQCSYV